MLTERREKIRKIKDLPKIAEQSIKGLSEEQLNTVYRKGGWTVKQVIHHLADSHLNAFVRMKLILTEENPTLKPYDQDEWAKLSDSECSVRDSVLILKGLHKRWTALLKKVSENAWKRTAFHPENGNVTLESLLNTYSNHGEHHVKQILELRKAKNW
ncbi:putative metal-dependent hydrolase [bacterium]|nr:putative metal-dependent hydrolase [bacterium]